MNSGLHAHPTYAPPSPRLLGSPARYGWAMVATLVLAVFIVGAAMAAGASLAATRRGAGFIWTDVLIAPWLVAAVGLLQHLLLRQTKPLRRIPGVPSTIQTPVRRLVERSFLGVGPLHRWTATSPDAGLARIDVPEMAVVEQPIEGPEAPARRSDPADSSRRNGQAEPPAGRPTLTVDLSSQPMVPHVVERGQTFWSLAVERLGDGCHWAALRDVNLGREVAPGVVLTESSVLRQGWSIVLPVRRENSSDST